MAATAAIFAAIVACASAGLLSAKGFYCKDPDTGNLYSVNSTWPSTTFCGNYTCKIKKKINDMEIAPSRTIVNITQPDIGKIKDIKVKAAENNIYDVNEIENKLDRILQKHNEGYDLSRNILPPISTDSDRYLTKEEMDSITDLLKTVKKSDLEAIIEIYNLAQDIYKEMDTATTESVIADIAGRNLVPTKRNGITDDIENVKNDHTSYWYEPLNMNSPHKTDLKEAGSEFRPQTIRPYEAIPSYQAYQSHNPSTYFRGPVFNTQDFRKLAYYYPMSNVERYLSYFNQKPYSGHTTSAPCNPCAKGQYVPPNWLNKFQELGTTPRVSEPQKPYPLNYQNYNWSSRFPGNYNNFYKGNPWEYYDYYRSNPHHFLRHPKPNNVEGNSDAAPQFEEQKFIAKENSNVVVPENVKNSNAPWLTESLSDDVIEDVRANVAERAKLLKIPLKKRLKLERVAKVVKLDELTRTKRKTASDSPKEDEFEAYIETTTCEPSTEPGYFRVGNMTEVFPACCPQRIKIELA